MSLAQQQELESKYVMGTFARKPVEFVSGNGMMLTDDKGKQYLDFIGGIGVISLGHCAPALVKTLQEQTAKLMHVSNYYYIEHRGEVAEKLSKAMLKITVDGLTGKLTWNDKGQVQKEPTAYVITDGKYVQA